MVSAPYKASTGKCRLCTKQAISILRMNRKILTNKISDAAIACKHK